MPQLNLFTVEPVSEDEEEKAEAQSRDIAKLLSGRMTVASKVH